MGKETNSREEASGLMVKENLKPLEIFQDDDTDCRSTRNRYSRSKSSAREYNGRNISYEVQACALEKAEKLQGDLKSNHPSFVKSMIRSHVSSCFWLGIPAKFCKEHLPTHELKMVLEDEKGLEYNTIYKGCRTGLSGGWKSFAVAHSLEDGDAVVFELSRPNRFKVYIIKATEEQSSRDNSHDTSDSNIEARPSKKTRSIDDEKADLPVSQKPHKRITKRPPCRSPFF